MLVIKHPLTSFARNTRLPMCEDKLWKNPVWPRKTPVNVLLQWKFACRGSWTSCSAVVMLVKHPLTSCARNTRLPMCEDKPHCRVWARQTPLKKNLYGENFPTESGVGVVLPCFVKIFFFFFFFLWEENLKKMADLGLGRILEVNFFFSFKCLFL
jgi:hypothetical protein